MAIWRISLRFFSPPENPSLRYRSANAGSISNRAIHSRMLRRNSRVDSSKPLRADNAWRKKLMTVTPGISSGY